MFAFGIPGGPEWMIIFLVLLLLFGAKKLPELARGIGKSMGEFKKAKDEFQDEISAGEHESKKEPVRQSPPAPKEPVAAIESSDEPVGDSEGDSADSGEKSEV
ncbi:MAG: twin-arginine translocase TatA/TatE family subunit [Verrucomicrobiales bacterium]